MIKEKEIRDDVEKLMMKMLDECSIIEVKEEITRKEIEDHEKEAEKYLNICEGSRQKLTKQNKLFVDISTGIETIISILGHKNFEDAINNGIITNKNKQEDFIKNYNELIKLEGNKDLNEKLIKLNEILGTIENSCSNIRKQYGFDEEINKLDRKEENEIENIYIDAQDDIDEDDEYEAEEDIAPELPKEVNRKNDFDNMMRPYSAMPAKNNRIRSHHIIKIIFSIYFFR